MRLRGPAGKGASAAARTGLPQAEAYAHRLATKHPLGAALVHSRRCSRSRARGAPSSSPVPSRSHSRKSKVASAISQPLSAPGAHQPTAEKVEGSPRRAPLQRTKRRGLGPTLVEGRAPRVPRHSHLDPAPPGAPSLGPGPSTAGRRPSRPSLPHICSRMQRI